MDIRKDYNTVVECDPTFTRFTFEDFCWARMTVCSRIFGITIHDVKTDALVPLADMLNHRAPKQTVWSYCDRREGFVIESVAEIDKNK
jgi:histone-lysine N-methyltransferase SETD3